MISHQVFMHGNIIYRMSKLTDHSVLPKNNDNLETI